MNHINSQEHIDKKFLFRENRSLRLELKEAKQINELHKNVIFKLSQPHINSSQVISILLELAGAVKNPKQDNRLKQQIFELQTQLMVLEKIVEQANNEDKDTYHILIQDFTKMKNENERLEKELRKFYEKIGEVDYMSGLVTKHKQIMQPSEAAMSFKKEQEQLLEFICIQKEQIKKLSEEKKRLIKINIHMKEEVENQKEDLRNMTMVMNSPDLLMNLTMQHQNQHEHDERDNRNILDELDDGHAETEKKKEEDTELRLSNTSAHNVSISGFLNTSSNGKGLNTTLNNFIKMQKKIIKEEDEDNVTDSDEDMEDYEELNVLFPDKVERIRKNKETLRIPYLNMMKIREMNAKKEKKIRRDLDDKRINLTDKLIKLEIQIEITRKELTNLTLKFRNMEQEHENSLRMNVQLENRCNLLAQANRRLQKNYQNVYKDYQLTKVIAMRVEKAVSSEFEVDKIMNELNTTQDYEMKLSTAENMLQKIFGSKIMPSRSQSCEEPKRFSKFIQ